jgi:hypoxanthine phosphoribosyltransferase|tara:strand:+ start:1806 stop:2279 length:474 start_codon:yes stop_codon:yes gene_type:complete
MKTKDSKIYYEWSDYTEDMKATNWLNCDHVIGIYRGSVGMAAHISNVRDVPMSIIGFQTRDGSDKEPYWIHNATEKESLEPYAEGKTILIVDDIYDTGHTMNKVIEFVKKARNKPSTMPNVLGYCLFGKENAKDIVYSHEHDGSWIVFPWETLDESV